MKYGGWDEMSVPWHGMGGHRDLDQDIGSSIFFLSLSFFLSFFLPFFLSFFFFLSLSLSLSFLLSFFF